jgi:hypothetical protein
MTLVFENHAVDIESDRILLDGKLLPEFKPTAKVFDLQVSQGTLAVKIDDRDLITSQEIDGFPGIEGVKVETGNE